MPAKILVVDDDTSIVFMLKETLGGEGYQIIEAFDGQMAVELAKSAKPNLIIIDMNMPGLSGREAVEKIRAEVPGVRTPVLYLTGEAGPTAQEAAADPGTCYLEKPVDLEKLCSKVRATLSGRC
jgi:DNA-binding response OmpR family regulator